MTNVATESATHLPVLGQPKPAFDAGIDYELFLDCVHCGLCTSACPTYLELGTEADSPRGRIYLMRGVTDGRLQLTSEVQRHLELCLDCRSCETACPSGVQYGKLIEPFRVAMEKRAPSAKSADWFHRLILFPLFPYANRMRWALAPARFVQWLGIDRLINAIGLPKLLPSRLRQMYYMLPKLPPGEPPLPEVLPAKGKKRATVALLTGCVADAVFRSVHWATVRVLQENGCEVHIPRGQTCCGAIHYHAGAENPALERALTNVKSIDPDKVDAILVNVAGCGAMLKDYGHLHLPADIKPRAEAFARKVRDITEYLMELGPIVPTGKIPLKATYHDACHLCHAQQVRSQPRALLNLIPGLELAPLGESEICCGAAGTYNLTEPEMAERLVTRKADNIRATGAQAVLMANAGCLLHIGRKLREQGAAPLLAHPVELLDMSYRGVQPKL